MDSEQITLIEDRYSQRREAGRAGWAHEESYDRKASSFDRLVTAYGIPKGASVLELGCGSGTTALHMAEKGFEAYGIDVSAKAIEWTMDSAVERRLSAHFSVGSVTDLKPFQSEFFDLVFDGDCLWMVLEPDRAPCFASVFHKLKPGGIFYAQAHAVRGDSCERCEIAPGAYFDPVRLISTVRHVPMYQYSTKDGFLKEIEDAGFEILRTAASECERRGRKAGNEWPFVMDRIFVEARRPTQKRANQRMQRTAGRCRA